MSGQHDDRDQLLANVRVVAALTAIGLLVYAVVMDRDPTVIGLLGGAVAVYLGIAGANILRGG